MKKNRINFYLNGEYKTIEGSDSFLPLSSYLRYLESKTGTKVVCAEGDCGACSVLLCYPEREKKFKVVNSCILPVYLLDGAVVVTVEGLKDGEELSEVQKKFVDCHGSQCGFCTPGFVVAVTHMHDVCKKIDEKKVKNYTTGNLCRCTGYQPIIDSALAVDRNKIKNLSSLYLNKKITDHIKKSKSQSVEIKTKLKNLIIPTKASEVTAILKKNKAIRIISSGTDLGVQHNKERIDLDSVLSLQKIKELYEIKVVKKSIHVGAKVSLHNLQKFSEKKIPAFSNFLNIFASLQIRYQATLVGNIANGSPIADTIPFLLVSNAELVIQNGSKTRKVFVRDFYLGYKKLDLKIGEWIKEVIIPIPNKTDKVYLYKISQRRDLDISTVNAGFYISKKKNKIVDVRIAYGGVGPVAKRLYNVEKFLMGNVLNDENLHKAETLIQEEISPISDVRASAAFRRKVAGNLFRKFCVEEGGCHE